MFEIAADRSNALFAAAPPRLSRKRRSSPVGTDRRFFDVVPHAYLLLDRDFIIVDLNPAYAQLTMSDRTALLGQDMFAAFPDNPDDSGATGVANLTASLRRVTESRSQHFMPRQRYDIRDHRGIFVERYWRQMNYPLLDGKNAKVEFILHHVRDATAEVLRWDGIDRAHAALERSARLLSRVARRNN